MYTESCLFNIFCVSLEQFLLCSYLWSQAFDQDLFVVKSLLVINNKASKNILVYVAMLNGLGNVSTSMSQGAQCDPTGQKSRRWHSVSVIWD